MATQPLISVFFFVPIKCLIKLNLNRMCQRVGDQAALGQVLYLLMCAVNNYNVSIPAAYWAKDRIRHEQKHRKDRPCMQFKGVGATKLWRPMQFQPEQSADQVHSVGSKQKTL